MILLNEKLQSSTGPDLAYTFFLFFFWFDFFKMLK